MRGILYGTALACSIAVVAAAVSAHAREHAFEGRIRIGGTGIHCVREPCPRIGIMAAGEPGKPRFGRPMFAGPTLPPMKGAEADMARVSASWRSDACLIVEGRFSLPPLLEIRRVAGSCRPDE